MLEAIGTTILFIAFNLSMGNVIVVATGILSASIFSAKTTGAHFNAAITLGVFFAEGFENMRRNLKQTLVMFAFQFVGAYIG